jgi:hypothetical protein
VLGLPVVSVAEWCEVSSSSFSSSTLASVALSAEVFLAVLGLAVVSVAEWCDFVVLLVVDAGLGEQY